MGKVVYVMLLSLGIFTSIGYFEDAFAGPPPPNTIDLTGTIRDFRSSQEAVGGHPDFETVGAVPALTTGLVETTLGGDKLPVLVLPPGDTITSAASFFQWFHDDAAVNLSSPCTITLTESLIIPGVFSINEGDFFPIDTPSQPVSCTEGFTGFGNTPPIGVPPPPLIVPDHNYHFTFEIHTNFIYEGGEVFAFNGDDDIWVFINDELVVDLGGLHGPITGSIDVDTLGLTLDERYDFDFFFAERHSIGSQFQFTTTLGLNSVDAVDDAFTILESGSIIGGDLFAANPTTPDSDPNNDPFFFESCDTTATNPTAIVTCNADGTFDYDPNGAFDSLNAGESTTDTFDYTINDGIFGATSTATVTITIDGVGTAPGTITVIKESIPPIDEDFGFTIDQDFSPFDSVATFDLCDFTSTCTSGEDNTSDTFSVDEGEHIISETSGPADYVVTDIVCTLGGSDEEVTDMDTSSITLDVADGEDWTCTFTNGPQDPANIGDFVWDDIDMDGIQDAGEPGIAGVTVNLLDSGSNEIDTATTDANGNYSFDTISPGSYFVEFELAAGFAFSPQDQGGDDTVDSDADTTTGLSALTALNADETNLTVDAGMYMLQVDPCEDLFVDDSFPTPNFLLGLLVPEHLRAYGGFSAPPADPCANLSISISDSPDPVGAGDTLTYTVTVTNGGPFDAENVVVTNTLPGGVTFVSTTGCAEDATGVPTCTLGTIPNGGSASYTIEITVSIGLRGTMTNIASVSSSTFDDDLSNNSVTESTIVTACDRITDVGCKSNQGGTAYPDPNLGDPINRLGAGHDNGFCMGQNCINVRGYFNHFPETTVPQGSTQSFTLLVNCQRGAGLCNHFEVAGGLPDSNFYEYQWAVTVDRQPGTDNWDLTVNNPFGEIGEVTAVVQQIDQTFITATFNVEFLIPGSVGTPDGIGDPQENNRHLRVTLWDSNGGMRNYVFNEGMYVDDIYAYPQVEYLYDNALVYEELCLNENPNKRYTCAFDKVKDWTIKNAEDKLKEIYDIDNYDTVSEVN